MASSCLGLGEVDPKENANKEYDFLGKSTNTIPDSHNTAKNNLEVGMW